MTKVISSAAIRRYRLALMGGSLVALLLAANIADACEVQPRPRGSGGPAATSWVLALNSQVSVVARCNGMIEAIGRMAKAGSALRISIFGYDRQPGSRSLSLAYVAAVTEELRSALLQKSRGQVRIHTVFGAPDDDAGTQLATDADATGRIEIRVHGALASAGS